MISDDNFRNDSTTNTTQSSNTKTKKVKTQVKSLGYRTLEESETIINFILSKLNRIEWTKYFTLRKRLVASIVLIDIIIGTILTVIQISFVATLTVRIILLISLVYFFINCNYHIFKDGMKSFIVWYKIIHSFIASVAHVILSYPSQDTVDKWKEKNEYGVSMAIDLIYVVNVLLFVLVASLSDGYAATSSKSMKLSKYIILSSGVLYFVIQWCYIYFYWDTSIENIDKQFRLSMTIFGSNINESFSYKAMALSSYSKLVCFLGVQLYRHIKHPHRINTIPILIEIKKIDYDATELNTNTVNFNSISTESPKDNIDNATVHQPQLRQESDFDIIDVSPSISSSNNNYQTHIYQVELIRQKTLWFWIFNKLFNVNKIKSAEYANVLLDRRVTTCFSIALATLCTIRAVVGSYLNGIINICAVIGICLVLICPFCNVNKNYFKFKKFSFSVLWKVYNFIVLSICTWIIERENRILDFNQHKTQAQGDVIAAFNLIGWILTSLILSLWSGLFWSKRITLSILLFLCIYFIYRGTFYYFSEQLDTNMAILNQQVSIRNQQINRSMDMALWFGYKFYQSWKYPDCFQVTSKIEIKWNLNAR